MPYRDDTRTSTIRWTTSYCERCKSRTTWWLVNDRLSRCSECDTERHRGQGLALDSEIFRDDDLAKVRARSESRNRGEPEEGADEPPPGLAKPVGLDLDSKIFREDEEEAARRKAAAEKKKADDAPRDNPLGLDIDDD